MIDLFLDSGAFSAKSKSVAISLDDYIDFIKTHEAHITVYANLDVIGDPVATWKNQEKMESLGLHPLPVYHVEDAPGYLDRCIAEYEYFCLGGMASGYNSKERDDFIAKCFDKICDKDGYPQAKVHGFGLTSIPLITKFPWYSIDSTSWVMTSRMGSIFIPKMDHAKGDYDYEQMALKVTFSSKSPTKEDKAKHFDTLSPMTQNEILKYIHDKGWEVGESEITQAPDNYKLQEGEKWYDKKSWQVENVIVPGLSNNYMIRDEANIIYFNDLEAALPEWPWPYQRSKRRTIL